MEVDERTPKTTKAKIASKELEAELYASIKLWQLWLAFVRMESVGPEKEVALDCDFRVERDMSET